MLLCFNNVPTKKENTSVMVTLCAQWHDSVCWIIVKACDGQPGTTTLCLLPPACQVECTYGRNCCLLWSGYTVAHSSLDCPDAIPSMRVMVNAGGLTHSGWSFLNIAKSYTCAESNVTLHGSLSWLLLQDALYMQLGIHKSGLVIFVLKMSM